MPEANGDSVEDTTLAADEDPAGLTSVEPQPAKPPACGTRGVARTRPTATDGGTDTSKAELAIEQAIGELIASAPPLSESTRARLVELLSVTHRYRRNF
jgi:hypothetical protein